MTEQLPPAGEERSGGNMQRWRFLGVTDPDVKHA